MEKTTKITELNAKEKVELLAKLSFEKFARNVVSLEVTDLIYLTDYFLIMTVDSQPQMKAMVEHLKLAGREKGLELFHIEGEKGLTWMLMYFGDVTVHVFLQKERELYDLEGLWFQAKKEIFEDDVNREE